MCYVSQIYFSTSCCKKRIWNNSTIKQTKILLIIPYMVGYKYTSDSMNTDTIMELSRYQGKLSIIWDIIKTINIVATKITAKKYSPRIVW